LFVCFLIFLLIFSFLQTNAFFINKGGRKNSEEKICKGHTNRIPNERFEVRLLVTPSFLFVPLRFLLMTGSEV